MQVVTIASLKEDKELQTFFTELVSNYLFTEGALARIDILNCPIEEDAEGKQVVNFLSKLTGVPVYSSKVNFTNIMLRHKLIKKLIIC